MHATSWARTQSWTLPLALALALALACSSAPGDADADGDASDVVEALAFDVPPSDEASPPRGPRRRRGWGRAANGHGPDRRRSP